MTATYIRKFRYAGIVMFLMLCMLAGTSASPADASDITNCLLCHKYPGISRVDEEGKLRLFYVNEDVFNNSVHMKVKCEGCHTDIKKIPHDTAKKVDCLVECHITEPSTETKFSHRDVATYLEKSVHSTKDEKGQPKEFAEDLPSCKECHDNPLYRPLSFFKSQTPGISEDALGRCRTCHKKEEFIYRFYNHITSRLHKTRIPLNIAEVCARCHDNPDIVARHNLSTRAAFSYGETFHGKAAKYLSEKIPDCLDCHVKKGTSVHQMLSHEDPRSSIHNNNRSNICSNTDCHPDASQKLSNYAVHAEFNLEQSKTHYFFTLFFIMLTGGTLLPLMGIIFLDLVRRFFPNASMKRRKK